MKVWHGIWDEWSFDVWDAFDLMVIVDVGDALLKLGNGTSCNVTGKLVVWDWVFDE